MDSEYSPAKIESMPEAELPKAREAIIGELRKWESIIGGRDPGDAQKAYAEAEYRRYMLGQIRERLLLSATEKLGASASRFVNLTILIEYLTRVLIALTALLVIQPWVIQLVGVVWLPWVAIAFILIAIILWKPKREPEKSNT